MVTDFCGLQRPIGQISVAPHVFNEFDENFLVYSKRMNQPPSLSVTEIERSCARSENTGEDNPVHYRHTLGDVFPIHWKPTSLDSKRRNWTTAGICHF